MGGNEGQGQEAASAAEEPPSWMKSEPAARPLELALLFWLVIHAAAMLATALLILPGAPGGPREAAARMAYVAANPWLWRLGWLPWQLAALANLLLALALVSTRRVARLPALVTLLVTAAAIIPDQAGQALWVTRGIALAQAGRLADYLPFEHQVFLLIGAWGSMLYTLAALGWTWCFVRAGLWRRWLTFYSIPLWAFFALFSVAPFLTPQTGLAPTLIDTANGVGFVFLLFWVAAVLELLLRRSRPDQPHGRYAPWRHPSRRFGWLLNVIGNSRVARTLCEFAPVVAMRSNIRDVLYINYLVEVERVEWLVPPGLALQRLGPDDRYALLTFLSFRHGHFGPRVPGPLRKLLPSPVQTNWRIYVADPRTGKRGVYFFSNAISSTLYALGARLFSEGMPMHALARGELHTEGDGCFHLHLEPGTGSAPDAEAILCLCSERPAGGPWSVCFENYEAMLAYCVPQDRALSVQPWYSRVTRQEITLGIPLEECEPLEGDVCSRAAQALVGDTAPFCFRVANVYFRFEREEYDKMGNGQSTLQRLPADLYMALCSPAHP